MFPSPICKFIAYAWLFPIRVITVFCSTTLVTVICEFFNLIINPSPVHHPFSIFLHSSGKNSIYFARITAKGWWINITVIQIIWRRRQIDRTFISSDFNTPRFRLLQVSLCMLCTTLLAERPSVLCKVVPLSCCSELFLSALTLEC